MDIWPRFVRTYLRAANFRLLRSVRARVDSITNRQHALSHLPTAKLVAQYLHLQQRALAGESARILEIDVFAIVGELAARLLNMQPFPVQYLGALVLRRGKVIQMGTGEGKTLVATLPIALEHLYGRSVTVITANEYLAARDAAWMNPLYSALGIAAGFVDSRQTRAERKRAYRSHVVYASPDTLIFDLLSNSMVRSPEDRLPIRTDAALIDEIDAVLIDAARQPYAHSKFLAVDLDYLSMIYDVTADLIPDEDYRVHHDEGWVELMQSGIDSIFHAVSTQRILSYTRADLMFHAHCCLWAQHLCMSGKEYLVENNAIVVIDENTGRPHANRAFPFGYQQALEVKEGLAPSPPSQPVSKATVYGVVRSFNSLCGMSGSAFHDAFEFKSLYGLDVVPIPPNKPVQRVDHPDEVYRTKTSKFRAAASEVQREHSTGRPVLIGTVSVEDAERFSHELLGLGIESTLLTARNHRDEASAIEGAGQPGAVTVVARMAGRGVDIRLTDQSVRAGGLHVIGIERNSTRRLDEQLQGRCGRQGDPGSSRFYLSLEDPLLRIFASDRVAAIMQRLNMSDDEAIEHPWVTRSIRNAQRKLRDAHFLQRRSTILTDGLLDGFRREFLYRRSYYLSVEDIRKEIAATIRMYLETLYPQYLDTRQQRRTLLGNLFASYGVPIPVHIQSISERNDFLEELSRTLFDHYVNKWNELQTAAESDSTWQITYSDSGERLDVLPALNVVENEWERRVERSSALPDARYGSHERDIFLLSLDLGWAAFLSEADRIMEDVHFETYGRNDLVVAVAGSRLHAAYSNFRKLVPQRIFDTLLRIDDDQVRDELYRWRGTIESFTSPALSEEVMVIGTTLDWSAPVIDVALVGPSIDTEVDLFLRLLSDRKIPRDTIAEFRAVLKKFAAYAQDVSLSNVSALSERVAQFMEFSKDEGLSRRQRKRQLKILGDFFQYLVQGNNIAALPFPKLLGLFATMVGVPLLAKGGLGLRIVGSIVAYFAYVALVDLPISLPRSGTSSSSWLGESLVLHFLDDLFLAGALDRLSFMSLGVLPGLTAGGVYALVLRRQRELNWTLALPFQVIAAGLLIWWLLHAGVIAASTPSVVLSVLMLVAGCSVAHLLLYVLGQYCILGGIGLLIFGNSLFMLFEQIAQGLGAGLHPMAVGIALLSAAAVQLMGLRSTISIPIERAGRFNFISGTVESHSAVLKLPAHVGYVPHMVAFISVALMSIAIESVPSSQRLSAFATFGAILSICGRRFEDAGT